MYVMTKTNTKKGLMYDHKKCIKTGHLVSENEHSFAKDKIIYN